MKKITTRWSDEEYKQMIEKKNALNFRKLNDFHKQVILNFKTNENLIRPFLKEFSHQGNNLNQIAYKLNSGTITKQELLEEFQKIQKQQKEILNYVSKQFN